MFFWYFRCCGGLVSLSSGGLEVWFRLVLGVWRCGFVEFWGFGGLVSLSSGGLVSLFGFSVVVSEVSPSPRLLQQYATQPSQRCSDRLLAHTTGSSANP